MTDQEKREKVVNKVKAIVADMQEEVDEWKDYSDSELRGGLTCDCDWWYKTLQTLKDALALLKAQEPEKPNAIMHGKMVMYYQCPSCLATIDPSDNFCRRCGRPVKWDG